MEIKTKFKLDDEIWYVNSYCKIVSAKITDINIRILTPEPIILLSTDICDKVNEKYAFHTKEELINYITTKE